MLPLEIWQRIGMSVNDSTLLQMRLVSRVVEAAATPLCFANISNVSLASASKIIHDQRLSRYVKRVRIPAPNPQRKWQSKYAKMLNKCPNLHVLEVSSKTPDKLMQIALASPHMYKILLYFETRVYRQFFEGMVLENITEFQLEGACLHYLSFKMDQVFPNMRYLHICSNFCSSEPEPNGFLHVFTGLQKLEKLEFDNTTQFDIGNLMPLRNSKRLKNIALSFSWESGEFLLPKHLFFDPEKVEKVSLWNIKTDLNFFKFLSQTKFPKLTHFKCKLERESVIKQDYLINFIRNCPRLRILLVSGKNLQTIQIIQ